MISKQVQKLAVRSANEELTGQHLGQLLRNLRYSCFVLYSIIFSMFDLINHQIEQNKKYLIKWENQKRQIDSSLRQKSQRSCLRTATSSRAGKMSALRAARSLSCLSSVCNDSWFSALPKKNESVTVHRWQAHVSGENNSLRRQLPLLPSTSRTLPESGNCEERTSAKNHGYVECV